MQFDSMAAALAMDGHGPYVWAVVLVTTAIVAGLLLFPIFSSRRALREQREQLQRGGHEPAATAVPTAIIEEVNNASGT